MWSDRNLKLKLKAGRALRRFANRLDPQNYPQIRPRLPRECSICGYTGLFGHFGVIPRPDAKCPGCGSIERHRFLKIALDRNDLIPKGARVLHFAPEPHLEPMIAQLAGEYVRADISPERGDVVLNIEKIDAEDCSFDCVICFHVLEHVDDAKALPELFRITKYGGRVLLMVPIAEGWDHTYENDEVSTPREREAHFGQYDHVRYYGRDFRDRVLSAGFFIEEITTDGKECVRFSLMRGERIFVAHKPARLASGEGSQVVSHSDLGS